MIKTLIPGMSDNDAKEILDLLNRIDYNLAAMQNYDALRSIYGPDISILKRKVFSSLSILIIQICTIYFAYMYLSSNLNEIQPIAIVGIVGIIFTTLNSIITAYTDINSLYIARHKLERDDKALFAAKLSTLEQTMRAIEKGSLKDLRPIRDNFNAYITQVDIGLIPEEHRKPESYSGNKHDVDPYDWHP